MTVRDILKSAAGLGTTVEPFTLYSWGNNNYGVLGYSSDVTTTTFIDIRKSSPVQVGLQSNWLDITGISMGLTESNGGSFRAIKTDGTLWALGGFNPYGALGLNDIVSRSSPVQVGTDTTWNKILDSNGLAAIFSKIDNSVWGVGISDFDDFRRSSPIQIGSSIKYYYLGYLSRFYIKSDDTLWGWKSNSAGQLGTGNTIFQSSPVLIANGVRTVVGAGPNSDVDITTQFITTDNKLLAIGSNSNGKLGTGEAIGYFVSNTTIRQSRSSPSQIGSTGTWISVSFGSDSAVGIKTNRSLWAWGRNSDGQLGTGNTISRSSPVQVGTSVDWKLVSMRYSHSLAIKSNGTLWAWGHNFDGQLGTGDVIYRSSPVQVGTLTNWAKVSAGANHSFAIKNDGTLWAWGSNAGGQLGTGELLNKSSPVQVGTLTNWATISANQHSLAVKTDGTLWAWGGGLAGELGTGDNVRRSSPVQVGTLTNWKSAVAGNSFSLGIKTDGTLWVWGYNFDGQLGTGDVIYRSSPVQVGTLTNWAHVNAAVYHTIALKTDGTFWAWGGNQDGQLGTGNTISRSSPVQVGSLTNWIINTAGTNASAGGTS